MYLGIANFSVRISERGSFALTTAGVEELVLAGFDSRLPEELEGSGTGLGVGAGSSCEELAGDVMEERLIAAVRKRICLYDVRDPDYRVNEKRLAAWEEIGQELGVGGEFPLKTKNGLGLAEWNRAFQLLPKTGQFNFF